jgi:hypothetical protein
LPVPDGGDRQGCLSYELLSSALSLGMWRGFRRNRGHFTRCGAGRVAGRALVFVVPPEQLVQAVSAVHRALRLCASRGSTGHSRLAMRIQEEGVQRWRATGGVLKKAPRLRVVGQPAPPVMALGTKIICRLSLWPTMIRQPLPDGTVATAGGTGIALRFACHHGGLVAQRSRRRTSFLAMPCRRPQDQPARHHDYPGSGHHKISLPRLNSPGRGNAPQRKFPTIPATRNRQTTTKVPARKPGIGTASPLNPVKADIISTIASSQPDSSGYDERRRREA